MKAVSWLMKEVVDCGYTDMGGMDMGATGMPLTEPYPEEEDPDELDICLRRRARRLLNHTWMRASVSLVR